MNRRDILAADEPAFLKLYQERVEAAIEKWLPSPDTGPKHLHEAMRYALFSKGKRIRPALVYATGELLGLNHKVLNAPAVAVEAVHTYSLIHDDLPAMDDDDLRRGVPACHKAYDEATAILAGNSLQSLAFHVLASDNELIISDRQRARMIDILAQAAGSKGMAGGQADDLIAAGKKLNLSELENIYIHKTAVLIKASVKLGALSKPDIETHLFDCLSQYAGCIGLAFQIQDDIMDIESNARIMGKLKGSDLKNNKPTYPGLLGLDQSKDLAKLLHKEAVSNLSIFGEDAAILKQIADHMIYRKK